MLDTNVRRGGARVASGNRKRGDTAKGLESDVVQWTVKGIDRETLELSRRAARKRGMKFGAWVAQALKSAVSDENEQTTPNGLLLSKIAEIEFKIDSRVDELKRQTSDIQHDVRVLQLLVPKLSSK